MNMPATINTQLLSFIVNQHGSMLTTSSSFANWLGYTVADLEGNNLQQLLQGSSYANPLTHLLETAAGQVKLCCFLHKAGHELMAFIQPLSAGQDPASNFLFCNVKPLSGSDVDDLKKSEQLETELEWFINHTEESFVVVNKDLEIIRFNDQFYKIYKQYLGKTIVKGRSIMEYAYSKEIDEVKGIYARALQGEHIVKEIEIPGNPAVIFSLKYKPLLNADGVIDAVFVSANNITSQKEAERLLILSEKRYKALVEHGLDAVVVLTEDGKPLYVSPAVEKILGYNKEECETLDLFSLTHPDDLEKVAAVWQQVMEQPGVPIAGAVSRIRHKDGSWRWLQDTITNQLHEPSIAGIVDNFTDVTDELMAQQKLLQKQQELEQAEANYREIFEKANEGILIYDIKTGLLTQVNPKACELLGCTERDLMSSKRKQYEADHPGYNVAAAMVKFKKAVSGENQVFEWPVKRKDGVDTWLELSLTRANIAGTERVLAFFRVIDERKKAEQENEFQRRDKEALMNNTGEFIWSVDKEYKLLAANEPFLSNLRETIGYTLKAGDLLLVGKFYTEAYLIRWKRLYNRAFEGQRFTEEIYRPANDNDSEHWVEISFNPVYVDNKVSYVTCFGRDVTENKLYQQQLQFTNDKLNIAQQIAKLGVWELDLHTQEFTCSGETYLIFGLQQSDFSNNLEGFVNMIHPKDKLMFENEFQFALEGEKLLNVEARIITPRDLVKTVVLRGSVVYDAANNPARFNGTVQDITERKYLQEQLVASQRQLDLIYNSVNDIIFLMAVEPGERYRFESVNQAFLNSLQADKSAIINKYIQDVIPIRQVPIILKYYRQALEKGKPVSWQASSPNGDKSGIVTITPVANDEGKFTQIIGSVHDITEIKRTGEKLVSLNERLKQQAKAMTESNHELERFAYVASHDLQEPLRMISSFLKLLEKKYEGQLDETATKYIYYAVDGSERMKRLIMDLLAYSKVSTNDDVLSSTDMNVVVAEVLHILDNKIVGLGATIEVGKLPVLENTRRTQMLQLLQNLVGNALKYHGQQPPVISITARERGDKWEFAVKDNGVGFEQKFADTVFVMFQRLHHRSEFTGTGIGLSICKKIVEMHHGNIWVESVPNEGSTFYFSIAK